MNKEKKEFVIDETFYIKYKLVENDNIEIEKIKECLGLFNSMICSGEEHTSRSLKVLENAKNEVVKIEESDKLYKEIKKAWMEKFKV